MLIRQARPEDAPALRESCFDATPVAEIRAWIDTARAADRDGTGAMLVAADDLGTAVGTLSVSLRTHRLERHRAEIGGFVIRADHRGTGLARRLADAAAGWARDRGCTILELTCRGGTHAEAAYRGLGFREWGRLPAGLVEPAGTFDQVNFYMLPAA